MLKTQLPPKMEIKRQPLPCGEDIPKSHKIHVSCGLVEELIGAIGRLKAIHFGIEKITVRTVIFSRLTKIQEDLFAIIKSIITTPKMGSLPGKQYGHSVKNII